VITIRNGKTVEVLNTDAEDGSSSPTGFRWRSRRTSMPSSTSRP
jgi:hypothetical protein